MSNRKQLEGRGVGDDSGRSLSTTGGPKWKYEPDENPKRKHAWDKSEPGFIEVDGVTVAKCPHAFSLVKAAELLNQGIPVNLQRAADKGYPKRIYIVFEGHVYRAMPTNPGVSYHAFPELSSEFRKLPRWVRDAVLTRAQELNCYEAVRRWMNE